MAITKAISVLPFLPSSNTTARVIGVIVARVIGVIVALGVSPLSAHGQAIDSKEFHGLYVQSIAKLADYYNNHGMVVKFQHTFVSSRPNQYKNSGSVAKLLYKAKDPYYLLESTENATSDGENTVRLVNKQGFFQLKRPIGSQHFIVTGYHDTYSDSRNDIIERARVSRAAFSLGVDNLSDLFTNTKMKITSCVRRDNRYVVNYHWFGRRNTRIDCQLVLDAERCMAQLEHSSTNPENSWKQSVHYEGEDRGVPLIKRVEITKTDDRGTRTETWEVEEHLSGPLPDQDFTLAAYGINDPFSRSVVAPWMYMVIALAVCAAGVFFFRAYRRRRQRIGTVA